MYTIGQVSQMFNLPISTLRYYDKMGLLPGLARTSGIRRFDDDQLEALRVIECLKQSGLEIRDIKKFMDWCQEGPSTYAERLDLFRKQLHDVDEKIAELQPKADFFDAFVNPVDGTNIRSTAKELGIPERMFCKFLQDAGFLYRCPAGNLMPYSKPSNDGLFIVRDYYTQFGHHGTYTLITAAGKNLIRSLLNPERKDA